MRVANYAMRLPQRTLDGWELARVETVKLSERGVGVGDSFPPFKARGRGRP